METPRAATAVAATSPSSMAVEEFKSDGHRRVFRVSFFRVDIPDKEFSAYLDKLYKTMVHAERRGIELFMEFNLRELSAGHMAWKFLRNQITVFDTQDAFLKIHEALFKRVVRGVTLYEPKNAIIASVIRGKAKKNQLVPTNIVRYRDV